MVVSGRFRRSPVSVRWLAPGILSGNAETIVAVEDAVSAGSLEPHPSRPSDFVPSLATPAEAMVTIIAVLDPWGLPPTVDPPTEPPWEHPPEDAIV